MSLGRRLLHDLSALTLVAIAAFAVVTAPAHAAGETTHAFMAERAVADLPSGSLKTMLSTQALAVSGGASFPDMGYWVEGDLPLVDTQPRPSDSFGEASHWESFINAYVAHVRDRPDCGDLSSPTGPCAPVIAHLMGAAAHGLGDELWDWLFVPRVTDHGEYPTPNFFSAGKPGAPLAGNPLDDASSGVDYAMDEAAIWLEGRIASPDTTPPPVGDLEDVYSRMGLDVTPEHILSGYSASVALMDAERAAVAEEGPRVVQDLPWASTHFVTEPGGVDFTARAIAGYYEALWRKLTEAAHPAPRVTSVYPAPHQSDVPTAWLPARNTPGPSSGGGEQRIVAVLSNAVRADSVTPQTFRLLDPDHRVVTPLAGYPVAGPYGSDLGTHSMLLYPGEDLRPCTRYTAVLTTGLRDLAGAPLAAERRWRFTTRGC